jgi:hypothetical protein
MNKIKLIFLLLLFCRCSKQSTEPTFQGNSKVIGQWHTNDKNWPHWLMFDSLNNFYRWSFNEQMPAEPTAKFVATDSTIRFIYPPDSVEQELLLQLLETNKLTILPPDDRIMSTYIYQRDSFVTLTFAEIYIFRLTDEEADSLPDDIPNYQAKEDSIFEDAFYLLEHSWINYQFVDSTLIALKDGSTHNRLDLGGYGVIYFTNDSTYIREGFPDRPQFQAEIDSFFHFVNRVAGL